MKYVNEYTIGGTVAVAAAGAQVMLSPLAWSAFTLSQVGGFGLLALAAGAIAATATAGVKAAYNYYNGEKVEAKKEETIATRTRSKTKQAEEKKNDSVVNKVKTSAANAAEAVKTSAANAAEKAKDTTSSVFTSIGNGLKSAGKYVKSFFSTVDDYAVEAKPEAAKEEAKKDEAAKPEAKKDEAAKPEAKKTAAKKATAKVIAEEAAKKVVDGKKAAPKAPVTPAFAAKKAAAKKTASVAANAANRPVRARKAPVRLGFGG